MGNIEIANYFDNSNIDPNTINVYIFHFTLGKCQVSLCLVICYISRTLAYRFCDIMKYFLIHIRIKTSSRHRKCCMHIHISRRSINGDKIVYVLEKKIAFVRCFHSIT